MRAIITAKRSGNGATMYPAGCTSIEDLPCDLSMAIDQAYRIAFWQENLQSEEMPPKWMWHLEHELDPWFEEVDQIRKEKYGGEADDREEAPMMSNQDPDVRARFGK